MEIEFTREKEAEQAETMSEKVLTREEQLSMASEVTRYLHRRTVERHFHQRTVDGTRLAQAPVAVAALQARAAILKDVDLDELTERLEAIEPRRAEA